MFFFLQMTTWIYNFKLDKSSRNSTSKNKEKTHQKKKDCSEKKRGKVRVMVSRSVL